MFFFKSISVFLLIIVDNAKTYPQADVLTSPINTFSVKYYKEINSVKENENLVMSPLSAAIALAHLSMGAIDSSKTEIHSALSIKNDQFMKSSFKPVIEDLNDMQSIILNIANKIYIKDEPKYKLNDDFKKNSKDVFNSEIEKVDFSQNTKAAKIINSWVEKKTNNKIKNMISHNSLNSDTCLVLVNAIYFKGDWKSKFNSINTQAKQFNINKKDNIMVDTMRKIFYTPYTEIPELKAKALELYYDGKEASLIIILPDEVEGLKYVEEKLASGYDINNIFNSMRNTYIDIALPKFKIETKMDLRNILQKMNIKSIFSKNTANLSGLFQNNENLVVDKVVQKAFIEVNEKGTEAAAATTIEVVGFSARIDKPIPFHVNHPFIYILKTANNMILFMGKIIKF